jgi:hypothetical protein
MTMRLDGLTVCGWLEPEGSYHFPSARLRVNTKPMRKPAKKKIGRPVTTGKGTLVGVRLQSELLATLDDWRQSEPDQPGRPEALRRLAELGLQSQRTRNRP